MKWLKITIACSEEMVEAVNGILLLQGVEELVIEDAATLADLLAKKTGSWDYVDDSLYQPRTGARVSFFLTEDQDPEAVCRPLCELGLSYTVELLDEQEWKDKWKEGFHAFAIGERLVVCPSWEEYTPAPGVAVLRMDPGAAFGSGLHATTSLCLELLEKMLRPGMRMADIGCGSGILAIGGALLGAREVDAVDSDPIAVSVCLENCAQNDVLDRVRTRLGDLTSELSGIYDIISANIVADAILTLAPQVFPLLREDGFFIASGILAEREAEVLAALRAAGFQVLETRAQADWRAILAQKTAAPRRYALTTLGCKVNQEEGAAIAALLESHGWQRCRFGDCAELYIINTCTVTHLADRKSRAMIRRATKASPQAIVVVTGCYAQVSAAEAAQIPGVDLVVGVDERARLGELVEAEYTRRQKRQNAALIVPDVLQPHAFVPLPAPTGLERARAYLKVEDGCDQFCHYCVVPYARGPVRSLPLADALAQGRVLIAQGYPEIVLTGIHIGAYGQDFTGQRPNLGDLLQAFLALPGLGRLHLGSLEPQQCTETLLELVLNQEKICRHLHIPLQAGCDKTLAAMGRRYDTTAYAALCAFIRSMDPKIALTTDVMVGYPGESEADFATTYRFCQQIGFADMHVFAYSPRKRTVAAELPGQIAPPEKERRSKALLELAGQLRTNYGAAFVGQTLQFLFEQVVEIDGQPYYQGHSENYLPLLLPVRPDGPPVGRLVTVCGKTFADDRLYGEWLED